MKQLITNFLWGVLVLGGVAAVACLFVAFGDKLDRDDAIMLDQRLVKVMEERKKVCDALKGELVGKNLNSVGVYCIRDGAVLVDFRDR